MSVTDIGHVMKGQRARQDITSTAKTGRRVSSRRSRSRFSGRRWPMPCPDEVLLRVKGFRMTRAGTLGIMGHLMLIAHRMPYFSVLGILKYGIGWQPQNAKFENCSI